MASVWLFLRQWSDGLMSLVVDACLGRPVSQTPIWIMRQAGRYLPEYRALREKYNFHTMLSSPELAAEITLQPIRRFDFDAAILFSDILVIPEAMGKRFQLKSRSGPVFDAPVDSSHSIRSLPDADMEKLQYVFESITLVRRELDENKPLIGFSGAPWTIAAYLVEGGSSKDFRRTRGLMHSDPTSFSILMKKLTDGIINYIKGQIQAGADVVQIFDTHGGLLTRTSFERYSLPHLNRIVAEVKQHDVPVILFVKGGNSWFDLIKSTHTDVIGVDWSTPIGEVRAIIGDDVSLQGNLDPAILYGNTSRIREGVMEVLRSYGMGHRHIFNLGHGILPDIPLDSVHVLVDTIREQSPRFHSLEN